MVIEKEDNQECIICKKYKEEGDFMKIRTISFVKQNTKVKECEKEK